MLQNASFGVKMLHLIFIMCFVFIVADDTCIELPNLGSIEHTCLEDYESKETFFERVKEKSKSIFEMAKKKLGMEVDEEPRKCFYYECIFQHLGLMNDSNLPSLRLTEEWVKNNIQEKYKEETLNQTRECFDSVKTSEELRKKRNTQDALINAVSGCELSTKLTECLSKQTNCPALHFP